MQSWHSQSLSPGEACVWESVSGLCSHIMLWGTPISLRAQPTLPWKGRLWICFSKSQIPRPSEHGPTGEKESCSEMGHSECESLRGYCLGPRQSAWPPARWAGLSPKTDGSLQAQWLCLAELLLQRPQLAAPNRTLWPAPPGKSRAGDVQQTEWRGLGVGATFSSLSA